MQDYVFHVHRHDRSEPDVLAVAVRDDARAQEMALQRLVQSALYHTVEVWRREQRLFRVSRDEI